MDAYATSDLLAPHPSKPGYWKVYGRVDDQIMHSTGEKASPITAISGVETHCIHTCADKPRSFRFASLLLVFLSLSHGLFAHPENILNQDPHIQSAVIFGRGRFYPGVVVDPKPKFRFDPVDEVALTEFRNLIW